MQRIRWAWGVGLVGLGLTAAAAPAGAAPVGPERQDEQVAGGDVLGDASEDPCAERARSEAAEDPEDAGEETAGPRLELAPGRSPTQLGYAVRISGGAPRGCALVTLARDGAELRRSFVPLDERGCAEIVERNASPGGPIRVAAAIPPAPGTSPARAAIRAAKLDLTPPPGTLMGPGDVVICEIMKDPTFVSDSAGEWFEVRNRTTQPIDMEGWTITDAGSNSHVIHGTGSGVWILPRQYFVFGINADPNLNGGIQVHYKYSSFTLSNGADEIRLSDAAGNLVDVVSYDDGIFWPDEPGKSLNLSRSQVDSLLNDDGGNWCPALTPILGSFDFGTPRVANNNCL